MRKEKYTVEQKEVYLKLFWKKFREELLTQPVIHADETVLQVLKEKDRKPTDESRMWVYASDKRADRQIRLFRYEASRAGACAEEMLKGFQGVLIADGYSGYNVVSKAIRAGCWAHMRRKWREAMPEGATKENSKAAVGYAYCSRLFEIEISNNQVENAIRPLVVGRKNWLFSDTPEGADASAVVYSLIEMAKANGLNVEQYLLHILTVLPDRLARNPAAGVDDLLPWTDEMQSSFQA